METLCPSVQSSDEAVRDQLPWAASCALFYPFCSICSRWAPTSCGCSGSLLPVVHRHWAPIFSIVHTASTDTGRLAPAATGIVRAAWQPREAMARQADTESLTDQLLPLRLHSSYLQDWCVSDTMESSATIAEKLPSRQPERFSSTAGAPWSFSPRVLRTNRCAVH